jgi:hypothetical protein
MNKDWDKAVVSVDTWKECIRVLKSGSFAFIMSSPRQDVLCKMILNLIDAGFETNFTSIYWTYASGFPKAANVSKLVDKRLGQEREIVGTYQYPPDQPKKRQLHGGGKPNNSYGEYKGFNGDALITKSKSEQAKKLDGSYAGFQPKPALETILVVMKPLSEKSFVDQSLKNGKGVTWLDNVRIPYKDDLDKTITFNKSKSCNSLEGSGPLNPKYGFHQNNMIRVPANIDKGRFPANLIVSDDSLNDGKISGGKTHFKNGKGWNNSKIYGSTAKGEGFISYEDKGSYSRYFDLDSWYNAQFIITPKASTNERGIDNKHPTVKPLKLMSYLITMGSRPKDIILDPFCGSGTTCIAALTLGRQYIGIEKEKEYCEIAQKRLKPYQSQTKLLNF